MSKDVKSASPPSWNLGTFGRAEAIRSMSASLLRFHKGKGCAMSLADLGNSSNSNNPRQSRKPFVINRTDQDQDNQDIAKTSYKKQWCSSVDQPWRRKKLRWLCFVRLFDPVPFSSWQDHKRSLSIAWVLLKLLHYCWVSPFSFWQAL